MKTAPFSLSPDWPEYLLLPALFVVYLRVFRTSCLRETTALLLLPLLLLLAAWWLLLLARYADVHGEVFTLLFFGGEMSGI